MKKFYIFNAGCIRRGLDCIRIKKYLEVNGWKMANSPRNATLIIISTCGVVRANQENSLNAVQKAFDMKNGNAVFVITGCLPEIDPESLNKIGRFNFVPSGNIERIDEIVKPDIPIAEVKHPDSVLDGGPIVDYLIARSFCRRSLLFKKMFQKHAMNNLFIKASVIFWKSVGCMKKILNSKNAIKIMPYYNIKIADGCMSTCSYCSTRFATGTLRSRPLSDVLDDFSRGIRRGYKFFQLISEDTGCYGLDIGSSITDLLSEIFKIEGDYKIVLIDFNPWWLITQQDALIPLLAKNQNRVKEIFAPFQSGSEKILKLMNREYYPAQLIPALKRLRKEAPDIKIRTCVIVGFPGEDEDDFRETQRVIREIDFAEVAVNRYEDRPLTKSSEMDFKVSHETIEARARFLVENCDCKLLS